MFPIEELQRLAGKICLLLVAVLGMMSYHFGNVRFLPIMAGFGILAGVCHFHRGGVAAARPLRQSGQHPIL
ncbi:MAG TPA: hypothetical protein VH680_03070 [Gemmatimonadales bacterium]|jgi:hypothetical protein